MFSRVLVLAEGVTEEQVLPSLIQAYFGQSCSALGINCIGVGGVNYAPFIKMAVSFGIPVVVISDNESNINTKVNKVIANIIDKFNLVLSSDVFYLQFLQPNNNFESELLGLYLRNEIIDALMLAYKEKDSDEIHRQIKEQELNSSSNEQLFKEMKSSKSTYSGFLADIILENPYNKDFKTLLSLPLNNAFEKIAEWIK